MSDSEGVLVLMGVWTYDGTEVYGTVDSVEEADSLIKQGHIPDPSDNYSPDYLQVLRLTPARGDDQRFRCVDVAMWSKGVNGYGRRVVE